MTKYFYTIIIAVLCVITVSAQQGNKPLQELRNKFEAFRYKEVVSEADSLLENNPSLGDSSKIDIYRMKGISLYTMNKGEEAKQSFIHILELNSSFMLDSTNTSPKIISFFNNIKVGFAESTVKRNTEPAKIDTLYLTKKIPDVEHESKLKQAMVRSVLLPGLGHLYLGQKEKGWVLTSVGALSLGAAVYFIVDSNNKEKKYLDETNPALISSLYSKYNTAYKARNISLITFAAVWIYSQVDLLLNSGSSPAVQNFTRHTVLKASPDGGIRFSVNLNF